MFLEYVISIVQKEIIQPEIVLCVNKWIEQAKKKNIEPIKTNWGDF